MSNKHPNVACPSCLRVFHSSDQLKKCPHCQQYYHQACWDNNAGCVSPECQAEQRVETTNAETASPIAVSDNSIASAHPSVTPIDRTKTRVWWIPLALILFVVSIVIIGTVIIGILGYGSRAARKEFEKIEQKVLSSSPREAVEICESYIETHPANKYSKKIQRYRTQKSDEIDSWDWETAQQNADAAGKDFALAADAIERYLHLQPRGEFRQDAERQIRHIRERQDTHDYNLAANKADLHEQLAALEAYVKMYPKGIHLEEAETLIATFSEREEAERYQNLINDIDKLSEGQQYRYALSLLNSQLHSFQATKRQGELTRLRDVLRSQSSMQQWKLIQNMKANSQADREGILEACDSLMEAYPGTPVAGEILAYSRHVLEEYYNIGIQESDPKGETLDDLKKRFNYIKWLWNRWNTSDARGTLSPLIARSYYPYFQLLIREAQFPDWKTLHLKDGRVITGIVEIMKTGEGVFSVQVPGEKKRQFISSRKVDTVTPAPQATLGTRIISCFEKDVPDFDTLEALLQEAENLSLYPQADYLRLYLSIFDPQQFDSTPVSDGESWIQVPGGWVQKRDAVSLFGGYWDGVHWVSPVIHDALDKVAAELSQRVTKGFAESISSILPPVEVELSPMKVEVPVKCVLHAKKMIVESLNSFDTPLGVKGVLNYEVALEEVTPSRDQRIRARVLAAMQDLPRMAARLQVHIVEKPQHHSGIGLTVAKKGEDIVVATVLPNSPASEAGIHAGGVLYSIRDYPITNETEAEDVNTYFTSRAGDGVQLVIFTDGHYQSYDIQESSYMTHKLFVVYHQEFKMGDSTEWFEGSEQIEELSDILEEL